MDVFRLTTRWLRIGCLALMLLCAQAGAADTQLIVLGDRESSVQQRFVDALRHGLEGAATVRFVSGEVDPQVLKEAPLVLALGNANASRVNDMALGVPVLYSLITRDEMQQLQGTSAQARSASAIYLDQPPARILSLVKVALPERQRVTVALGADSWDRREAIRRGCETLELACALYAVSDEFRLERVLQQTDHGSRVLVVFPDPRVMEPVTARNIILGTYRRGIALVGYSRALVKAGALMAVHTTPEQHGMEAAELVQRLLLGGAPVQRHPGRFSVSVNYQLARALRLHMEAESVLREKIERIERHD